VDGKNAKMEQEEEEKYDGKLNIIVGTKLNQSMLSAKCYANTILE
jgi:hypothetical protein